MRKQCERTATVSRHVGVRCENSERMVTVSRHVCTQCENSVRERLLLVVMLVYSVKTV